MSRIPSFSESNVPRIGGCMASEMNFVYTIMDLNEFVIRRIKKPRRGVRLIVHDGLPVIIQKSLGEESGLTIVDCIVGERPLPAGHLVGVHVIRPDSLETDYSHGERRAIQVLDAEAVNGLNPKRASFVEKYAVTNRIFKLPEIYGIAEAALARVL